MGSVESFFSAIVLDIVVSYHIISWYQHQNIGDVANVEFAVV